MFKAKIERVSSNLQTASVANQLGDTIAFVAFEKAMVFLVSAYAVAPRTSEPEAIQAGNAADEAIAREAQKAGVSRALLVLGPEHPHFADEKVIRVVEREFPQAVTKPEVASTTSAQAFIN